MARRRQPRYTARLDAAYTDDIEVWGGWTADRTMYYHEARAEAEAELVAALGQDFAHLATHITLELN